MIVAAVNGGMQMSRDGAHVPTTPEEIAEDARLCREAGAAIVQSTPATERQEHWRPRRVPDIIADPRTHDILIQTTNGIGAGRDPVSGETIWPPDKDGSPS